EEDLTTLVERFRTAGLVVRTDGTQLPATADTGLRLAVFRVVQESLTNVMRHAPGASAVVTVSHRGDRVEVEVVDDGSGVVARPGGRDTDGPVGHGHLGMRERVAVWGGRLETSPLPGGGYKVSA
ncbi:MAG TPA: two-component sensor histidine kinase, partial [Actinotalea sp.]|nr:two-component sensor histidine kinase [Actinotalea sp.]